MARLVLLQGGEVVPHDLVDEATVLGRHPDCEIQLQSNMVSRRHARLVRDGKQFRVEDLGSGNGTFVNGQRIDQPMVLKHEDRIKVGPLLLRFESSLGSSGTPDLLGNTAQFNIDFSSDENDVATIMESSASEGGFGLLEVRPEEKLKAVLEISRSLAGTIELEQLLPKILDTLFDIFPHADRGCILLKETDGEKMIPRCLKHRRESSDDSVKMSRTILSRVLETKQGVLSADAANDAQFAASESISSLTIRSMMCVPMLTLAGEPMGIINIDTQNPLNQFKKEDLDLLMALAGQAAMSYESARLLTSHMEKVKQDNEMQIARNVQHALLPEELPQVDGWEFFASYESAQAVGGDYYDCFKLDDDKICVSFGDVAGKGVPASLVMSRMASVVQSTMDYVHDVQQAAGAINVHMCAKAVEGRFVTYILAIIDLKTNEMAFVNAGHMSPMIRRTDGSIEEFDEEMVGVPIGVIEGFPFDVGRRVIEPGETVVIYTDGVSEAMAPDSELYGYDRLRTMISGSFRDAEELGRAVLTDVKQHANGREQNDDITLMAFGRNA